MIFKGASYNVGGRHMEVMNVLSNRPGSMTSIIEVKQGGETGKVELVLWNQSEGKQRHKKSTTIEIKRMPKDGGEFPHVEKVKEVLVRLLTRFKNGEDVKNVIADSKKNLNEKTLKPKVVRSDLKTQKCPECGDMFEKQHGLSIHMGRKHPEIKKCDGNSPVKYFESNNVNCDVKLCKFACKESELKHHKDDLHTEKKDEYVCETCSRWWITKLDLKLHEANHHKRSRKNGFKPVETPGRKSDITTEEEEDDEVQVIRKCEDCDIIVKGKSLLGVIQRMKKHKAVCTCKLELNAQCTEDECKECDEKFENSTVLRKHIKDYHNIRTISMSPKSKKRRDSELKEPEEDMIISDDDVLEEESTKLLKLLEIASWEEDRIDNEKMDYKTILPEAKVITKRKRVKGETSKNAKRVAKTIAHRETNRKEFQKKLLP